MRRIYHVARPTVVRSTRPRIPLRQFVKQHAYYASSQANSGGPPGREDTTLEPASSSNASSSPLDASPASSSNNGGPSIVNHVPNGLNSTATDSASRVATPASDTSSDTPRNDFVDKGSSPETSESPRANDVTEPSTTDPSRNEPSEGKPSTTVGDTTTPISSTSTFEKMPRKLDRAALEAGVPLEEVVLTQREDGTLQAWGEENEGAEDAEKFVPKVTIITERPPRAPFDPANPSPTFDIVARSLQLSEEEGHDPDLVAYRDIALRRLRRIRGRSRDLNDRQVEAFVRWLEHYNHRVTDSDPHLEEEDDDQLTETQPVSRDWDFLGTATESSIPQSEKSTLPPPVMQDAAAILPAQFTPASSQEQSDEAELTSDVQSSSDTLDPETLGLDDPPLNLTPPEPSSSSTDLDTNTTFASDSQASDQEDATSADTVAADQAVEPDSAPTTPSNKVDEVASDTTPEVNTILGKKSKSSKKERPTPASGKLHAAAPGPRAGLTPSFKSLVEHLKSLSKSKQEPIIVESDPVEKDVSGPPRRFQVGSSRSVKSTENTSATSASPTARGDSLRLPDEPTTGSDSGSRIFQEWTRNRRSKMGKDGSQDDWRQQDSLTPRQDTLESWGEDALAPPSPSLRTLTRAERLQIPLQSSKTGEDQGKEGADPRASADDKVKKLLESIKASSRPSTARKLSFSKFKKPSQDRRPAEEDLSLEGLIPDPSSYSRLLESTLVARQDDAEVLTDLTGPSEYHPIARLSHGLDRVLFNPGVHWVQDPRSRVYNFTPYIQKVPKVEDFAFERLEGFTRSSQDTDMQVLAKEVKKSYTGSTSSLSGFLSHIYFLIGSDMPVNTDELSAAYKDEARTFTPGQRMPTSILMNYKDGVYALDSGWGGPAYTSKMVLTWMGTMLENFLTKDEGGFAQLLRENEAPPRKEGDAREAFRFSKSEKFVMRSQLDCVDPRLPGSGVFDIKTRAALPIRMDQLNYEENAGYQIVQQHGKFESFEREYYDLIRSAFLKYSFQVQIGNMDGVIVAYHNTDKIFGFQYIPLSSMEQALYGGAGRGKYVFEKCVGLMEAVCDEVARLWPQRSVRLLIETEEGTDVMRVFAMPHSEKEAKEKDTVVQEEGVTGEAETEAVSDLEDQVAATLPTNQEATSENSHVVQQDDVEPNPVINDSSNVAPTRSLTSTEAAIAEADSLSSGQPLSQRETASIEATKSSAGDTIASSLDASHSDTPYEAPGLSFESPGLTTDSPVSSQDTLSTQGEDTRAKSETDAALSSDSSTSSNGQASLFSQPSVLGTNLPPIKLTRKQAKAAKRAQLNEEQVVELFKRDAAPHDNLNASQAGDTPEEPSVSDSETIVEFEVRVRNVLGSRAVPAAEAIANVGMQPWHLQYTISTRKCPAEESWARLREVRDRQTRVWSLPSGMSVEDMAERFEEIDHGGVRRRATRTQAGQSTDVEQPAFKREMFGQPTWRVRDLRELAKEGRRKALEQEERDRGRPQVVLGSQS